MEYEPVIGLEVHVQLNTKSKIFCSCPTDFGAEPNNQTCPVCLGLPGVLPVLNEEALKKGVMAGLALNLEVAPYSKFDRKNYFYPDLPKAYQISQYDKPICENGYLNIETESGNKRIGITRLHLEEDAGKSIHSEDPGDNVSFIDLNRTGVPLAEIVSEPEISSGDEAYEYLQKVKTVMKYIEASDCNMEEGSLRCDVNISIREKGTKGLGEKVEIKNLNSFKAVRQSIDYETKRQIKTINAGDKIIQETRLWDADQNETYGMRIKEDAHDYRYFPDPDLAPMVLSNEYIETIRRNIPELPDARKKRFITDYSLPEYDAGVLTSVKQLADYFESVVKSGGNPKKGSNWIMSELLGKIDNPEKIGTFAVKPDMLSGLLKLIDDNTISGKIAKKVFDEMLKSGKDPETIVSEQGLRQVSDISEIESMVDNVISNNQKSVDDYYKGAEKAIGYLVGQVMKESRGKANPQIVNELIKKKLDQGS